MSYAVICWNNQLIIRYFWNYKGWLSLWPILPYQFLHIVEHIKHMNFLWQLATIYNWSKLIVWIKLQLRSYLCRSINYMNKKIAEIFSTSLINCSSYWPYTTKYYQVRKYILYLFLDFCLLLFIKISISSQKLKKSVSKSHLRLMNLELSKLSCPCKSRIYNIFDAC